MENEEPIAKTRRLQLFLYFDPEGVEILNQADFCNWLPIVHFPFSISSISRSRLSWQVPTRRT
jgi:hypothetical protein